MTKTVAIVGFSDWTLPYLQDSKAEEIWTMNHHLFLDEQLPENLRYLKRGITRLFEIHRKGWFLRKEIPQVEEYWAWLQKPHTFPIYTIDPIPDIPSNVVYPREALKDEFFQKFLRGEKVHEYYTSSFALMMALAIYEKFDVIEIYGIEMATDTEYADQRPGGEFWIGYALGKGIAVKLHPKTHLCNAVVYGYEAVPHITYDRMLQLIALYRKKQQEANEVAKKAVEEFNSGKTKDHHNAMAAEAWSAMYTGATQMLEIMKDQSGTYVSAQFLEEYENRRELEAERFKADTNVLRAEFNILKTDGRDKEADEKWSKYLDARATMYALSGAQQVIHLLREECKLRQPTHELRMQISS